MELRCVKQDGALWYDWKAVQRALNAVEPCALQLKFEQFPGEIEINGTWMSKKCMQKFLRWYADKCSYQQLQVVEGVQRALKPRRNVSKKYRWEIAHRQQYNCAERRGLRRFWRRARRASIFRPGERLQPGGAAATDQQLA